MGEEVEIVEEGKEVEDQDGQVGTGYCRNHCVILHIHGEDVYREGGLYATTTALPSCVCVYSRG